MSYPPAIKTDTFAATFAAAQEAATEFGVAYFVYSWPEERCFTAANVDLFDADEYELFKFMFEAIVARVEPEPEAVAA